MNVDGLARAERQAVVRFAWWARTEIPASGPIQTAGRLGNPGALEHAEYDRAYEGKSEIRGNYAQSADERTKGH